MPHPDVETTLSLRRQPFLYLTASLTAGILLDRWIEPGPRFLLTIALVSIAASTYCVLRKREAFATFALLVSFALVGALISLAELYSIASNRLKVLYESGTITPTEPVEVTGSLARPPEPLPGGFFLDVNAEQLRVFNSELTPTGTARLMIEFADEQAARE